jgi:Tc toxin complex TcA C-terminal TcB-binding domain
MASESRQAINVPPQGVEATVLGTTRVPPAVRDALVHTDPAPLHGVPRDDVAEAKLARAEDLLGKGHLGPALQEMSGLEVAAGPLAARYGLIRQEKVSRAQIGIANRYFLRGDLKNARQFFQQALVPGTGDPAVKQAMDVAAKAFDDLSQSRKVLIDGLTAAIQKNDFTEWCGNKKALSDLTILDSAPIRAAIYPDFRLEDAFGERPPIHPQAGYVDPLPVETELVAFPLAVPGATFRAATDGLVDIDQPPAGVPGDPPGNRLRASLALPVVANVFAAKAAIFALDQGLGVTGEADGVLPLFRYEHLRDKAKDLAAQVQAIETRMLPIQFALDDFAEIVDAIRRPLAAEQAELAAVQQRIGELTQALAAQVRAAKALDGVITAVDLLHEQCDCDWWCWVLTAEGINLVLGAALLVAIAVGVATDSLILVVLSGSLVNLFEVLPLLLYHQTISCDDVVTIDNNMKAARAGLQAAIADNQAELSHALARRDILIASINALSQQLEEVYQSNAARALDAKTLDLIQAQYNSLRQSLLTRAQAVAKLAESAFNFERDADTRLIKDAYYDTALKGYTAAETLAYDLSGLDQIDLTGRTQKALQLCQMVSLRLHSPISFLALAAVRTARFTTSLADFDRWYPGTYLQRIKEVRVEVLVDGQPVPARGYLSNDGVSLVRFADSQNSRPIDNLRVFPEPDPDIAQLCFKRLQRRRHTDTMAFPELPSYLQEERMRQLQARERNFFENVGLESTWLIELLPDQPFDLARISDVRVWFHYEALFDDNLKHILLTKRYVGRRDMVVVPIGQTIRDAGGSPDFAQPLHFGTTPTLFEVPAIDKKIVNAGFAIRLKDGRKLGGAATLTASLGAAPPVALTTNDAGVVATADDHPTGSGLPELAAMVHGKSVQADWTVEVTALPTGVAAHDIDELFLLLRCEYVT